jgi:hypothetical protein
MEMAARCTYGQRGWLIRVSDMAGFQKDAIAFN